MNINEMARWPWPWHQPWPNSVYQTWYPDNFMNTRLVFIRTHSLAMSDFAIVITWREGGPILKAKCCCLCSISLLLWFWVYHRFVPHRQDVTIKSKSIIPWQFISYFKIIATLSKTIWSKLASLFRNLSSGFMVYSHCTARGPRMRSMRSNKWCRNVHTGPR